ncbi:NAD(+) diphosphatase, partial [Enterobacter kobei]|nr:NAD(+) diphosphatase [Enterobacter kobei]
MERTLENLDHGWWIVSHEQKLWLPNAELPYGQAADFGLTGEKALQIGLWEDAPVWLVLQKREKDMASVRQLIDQDAG